MAIHIVNSPVVCIELYNLPGTIKGKVVVLIHERFYKTLCLISGFGNRHVIVTGLKLFAINDLVHLTGIV